MKSVNFGLTSNDYAKHRQGFPPEFFSEINKHGIGKKGQEILDIGTGTGTIARGLAKMGSTVIGIDIAKELMEKAKILDQKEGVSIKYDVVKAEEMNFADNTFDCVIAGQCWHWFDGCKVADLVNNMLKSNGSLIISHFDWIPITGNVAEVTEKLIMAYNPSWKLGGGVGIYPKWFRHIAEAGFGNIKSYTFDLNITYSHEDWRGRIRASAGIGASLSSEKIKLFDCELEKTLKDKFPENPLEIIHRVFTLIAKKVT